MLYVNVFWDYGVDCVISVFEDLLFGLDGFEDVYGWIDIVYNWLIDFVFEDVLYVDICEVYLVGDVVLMLYFWVYVLFVDKCNFVVFGDLVLFGGFGVDVGLMVLLG